MVCLNIPLFTKIDGDLYTLFFVPLASVNLSLSEVTFSGSPAFVKHIYM